MSDGHAAERVWLDRGEAGEDRMFKHATNLRLTSASVERWSPGSWRNKPIQQVPAYTDQARLEGVEALLRGHPQLVLPTEVRRLKADLASVAEGKAFLLQGGDCAESFAEFSVDHILGTSRLLHQMALVLAYGAGRPVVKVGRIAGQFAKPRSALSETIDGVELPTYRGDMINGPEFTAEARAPAPDRILRAYHQSAITMNLLRALGQEGQYSLRDLHRHNLGFVQSSPDVEQYRELTAGIGDAFSFLAACGAVDGAGQTRHTGELFTSHEALQLHYEEALTRRDPLTGDWYTGSGHMLWLGDRTRQLDGAHVEFLRGIRNPLGIKVGPTSTPDSVQRLIERLSPGNEPGRICLIARMGADAVEDKLPPIVRAVRREGFTVVWACDPMHGNTITVGRYKTRPFDRIASEAQRFFEIHRAEGTHAGGVHVEMVGKDVTECIGGAKPVTPGSLGERYHTACDPRLNANQSLELAFQLAKALWEERRQGELRASAPSSSRRSLRASTAERREVDST